MSKLMYLKIITAAILTSLCISCSDNDADVVDAALVGRWYLAEVHDGPRMFVQDGTIHQYPSDYLTITIQTDHIVFSYIDGKTERFAAYTAVTEQNNSVYLYIDQIPFNYTIQGADLKLHYCGLATCDHIPATFLLRRRS